SVSPVCPGGQFPIKGIAALVIRCPVPFSAQGMYEIAYTSNGRASSEPIIQMTGIPNAEPGRSQPRGAGAGGGARRMGSPGAGRAASGPNPNLPATQKPSATRPASTANPKATAM